MAIDFKTPEKFVFDHKKGKVTDKLRQLLGLVYETDGNFLDQFIDFAQTSDYSKALGKQGPEFAITRSNKELGNTQVDSAIIKQLESLEVGNNPGYSDLFEDFNFRINNNQIQNFSVQTVVRDLQESDIQKNNPDYPGGILNPDKKETSLKFAYAFETIRIQGEEQIVFRKVQLVNDSKELIQSADNEKDIPTEITRLKNLFYNTDQENLIEAEVIGEGSQSDFGIDKIYNIITIDLRPDKDESSLYDYKALINGLFTNYSSNQQAYQSIDKISFLKNVSTSFVASKTPGGKLIENQEEIFSDFITKTTGYNLTEANNLRTDLLNSLFDRFINPSNSFKKNVLPQIQTTNNEIKNKLNTDASFISVDNNLKNELIKSLDSASIYDSVLSSPFSYDLVDVSTKFAVGFKSPLVNWTQADLFRSANKKFGKFVFSYGARQDNLLRDAKLVGLKIVKSTAPYDPANPTNNIGEIQSFYLPLSSSDQDRQIRLFDSQIIYGKTYYYTLFGIYYVDGKYYFYPHTKINKAKEKTGSVEIVVGENKQETDDKNNKVYKNPCCEYNYIIPTYFFDNFVKPVNLSGDNIQKFKKDAQINQNLNNDQIFALDELSKIGLAWGKYITGGKSFASPYDFQVGTYQNVDPQLRKAFECFLCREGTTIKEIRSDASSGKNGFSYGVKDNQTNESPIILEGKLTVNGALGKYALIGRRPNIAALIDCTEFGWNTAYGAGIDSPTLTEPSLESIGKEKDSKEIYLDGEPILFQMVPRCRREDRTSIFTEKFKEFRFQLFESNARRTYEIPLLPSLENSVVSLIPLPPIVEFVPLADINNRIKIKFQESAASGFTKVQVDAAVKILNDQTFKQIQTNSNNVAKEEGVIFYKEEVDQGITLLARSEGDIKEIYAFKLGRVPTSLQDLIDNGERFILDYKSGKTAYFSNVLPNEKYYYAFVSRDVTGLFSTATETFQVEIVEDSGYVYTKIDLYDYVTKEIKVTTKEFQKLLKIKPSFEEMLPNETEEGKQKLGTNNLYSQYNFGGKSDTLPPRFKIRIKSKKTNRVFDINLKYSQNIKEITSKKLIEQLKKVSELVDQKKVKKNN